jgi:2-aminoadipate transaminase
VTRIVPVASRVRELRPSAISRAIRAGSAPGAVPLTVGSPADELVPSEAIADGFARVWRDRSALSLGYGNPEGHELLREFVALRQTQRGAACRAEDVIVTTGSQQALDLLGKLFLEPGDVVVVEAPSYPGALNAFGQYGATFAPVPMDEEGLRTDRLEEVLQQHGPRVRFLYTMPNFHNPTGRTMSSGRRAELVALAERHNVPVVEDDAYAELSFDGPPARSLAAIAPPGLVIRLGSMSKVLSPGLRVGWVTAAAPLLAKLELLKERTDLLTGTAGQLVAWDLVRDGRLDAHLAHNVPLLAARRDAMLAAVDELLPGWRRTHPAGGFFLWLTAPPGTAIDDLTAAAAREGVVFLPGPAFHVDGGGGDALRVGYAGLSLPQIREGVRRLAAAEASLPAWRSGALAS